MRRFQYQWHILVAVLVSALPAIVMAASMSAFPGAEGFGTETPGGRGGKVLAVTNLNDAGPGSFRAACEAEGPRIVVFNVGGYINLESPIIVKHPFLTVAGQTAPGGGICLRGGSFQLETHDVVVRYMRFRMGRMPNRMIGGFCDNVDIWGTPSHHHIVLDHCSISWGVSRNLVIWGKAHDITLQWCIFSEPLKDPAFRNTSRAYGGMGVLLGDNCQRLSVHHCVFAHAYQRNPRLKHGSHVDLVNNVIYDWDDSGAQLIGDFAREADAPRVMANMVNNWYQSGPSTSDKTSMIHVLTPATLYMFGNVSNYKWGPQQLKTIMPYLTLSDEPWPAPRVTTWSAKEAYEKVLAEAGASLPRRDAVDARIAREIREGGGRFIAHQGQVGGYPPLVAGEPWRDTDGDGMPDEWEKAQKLNPADPADGLADTNGNGYLNIEEWLNEKAQPPAPADKEATPDAVEGKVYGVGMLGNCCTHGAGICRRFMNDPRTRVVAAFERDPRRGRELAEVWGKPLSESYEAVINNPAVDFVCVTSDPCDKPGLVEKAAAAGKHIYINKPFAADLDGARRIAAAVEKYKVQLVHDIPMVRFVPVYARLLNEIEAGRHGKVMGYHHLFGMNFSPEFDLKGRWPERLDPPAVSGGGEMTNMGCYAVDYAVALFGKPRSVTAKQRMTWDVYREAGVENFGQIILDYGDFYAFLEVGKQQLEGEHRHANLMTINFEHETLCIDVPARQVTVNHVPKNFAAFAQGAEVVGSLEQMIAAIEDKASSTPDAASAVVATEVLMAAYQSIVEDRTITLPLSSGKNPLAGGREGK